MKAKFLILFILCNYYSSAQTTSYCPPAIKYSYDAAGNRIQRNVYPSCRLEDNGESNNYPGSDSLNYANQQGFEIKLFPNPTNGQMQAEATVGFMELEGKAVYIQTMKGELLHKQEIKESSFTLDFTTYSPGYYIVRILANGYSKNWKVQRLQ
ncbi:MAG: T9SS type A sorting domain-containing protein [Bacteroidia bacterium]|nr:T9SS type A sorting domain-containing protein [Bacteroidia bacterium]